MKNTTCPTCTTGALELLQSTEEVQYKGQTLSVDLAYAVCEHCGDEIILPEQIKHNDCLMRDAWRKADGMLTGEEIVAMRQKLSITQQQAAQMFGGGANAFSKYERNEVIQSEAMDKLMRLAMENEYVAQWLKKRAGLALKVDFSYLFHFDYSNSYITPFKPQDDLLKIPANDSNILQEEYFPEPVYG